MRESELKNKRGRESLCGKAGESARDTHRERELTGGKSQQQQFG